MNDTKIDPIGMHLGLALDGMTLEKAIKLAGAVAGEVAIFKANDLAADVGSKTVVKSLAPFIRQGGSWIDLKTNDTDGTMGNTMDKIGGNGAKIASVHLFNSKTALQRALKDAEKQNCVLTGISLLTSITKEEAKELYNRPYDEIVPMLVKRARELGFKSTVCSAPQLPKLISAGLLKGIVPIIPGTRSMTTVDTDKLNFQAETGSTEGVFELLARNNIQGIVVLGSEVYKAPDALVKLTEIKTSVRNVLQHSGLELIPKIPLLE